VAVAPSKKGRRAMARQKSEDRKVVQAPRKLGVTREVGPRAGAKAIPVDEEPKQLDLFSGTAEVLARASSDGVAARPRGRAAAFAAPKPKNTTKLATVATIDEVAQRLGEAFRNVERNRGAPGPDGLPIEQMREHLHEWLPMLRSSVLEGRYTPGDIRRVWIPKGNGSQRGLGIPNVIDRVVQEAVRLVLEPLYEPTFHRSSHGFRPGRSCHTAIAEAVGYVDEGYEWVVDLDLEKFFDRVNHQRLMSRLTEVITDKGVLVLISHMLKAKVVLPNGVVMDVEEGVPQGGPLSPLLSNVVLDELDRELERRGHRFVRYADDCNVYVGSERAGHRVMASIKQFIERRLRLKVNEQKSAVARPEERHFVGFSLRREPLGGSVEVLLSTRSKERVARRVRELTPRAYGGSVNACIATLNVYLLGWLGFFRICTGSSARTFHNLDAHIRRRLRAVQLHDWKRKLTIVRRLIKLGIRRKTAWRNVYDGRKSTWALSHSPAINRALPNSHWDARGLVSIEARWRAMAEQVVVPLQPALPQG